MLYKKTPVAVALAILPWLTQASPAPRAGRTTTTITVTTTNSCTSTSSIPATPIISNAAAVPVLEPMTKNASTAATAGAARAQAQPRGYIPAPVGPGFVPPYFPPAATAPAPLAERAYSHPWREHIESALSSMSAHPPSTTTDAYPASRPENKEVDAADPAEDGTPGWTPVGEDLLHRPELPGDAVCGKWWTEDTSYFIMQFPPSWWAARYFKDSRVACYAFQQLVYAYFIDLAECFRMDHQYASGRPGWLHMRWSMGPTDPNDIVLRGVIYAWRDADHYIEDDLPLRCEHFPEEGGRDHPITYDERLPA